MVYRMCGRTRSNGGRGGGVSSFLLLLFLLFRSRHIYHRHRSPKTRSKAGGGSTGFPPPHKTGRTPSKELKILLLRSFHDVQIQSLRVIKAHPGLLLYIWRKLNNACYAFPFTQHNSLRGNYGKAPKAFPHPWEMSEEEASSRLPLSLARYINFSFPFSHLFFCP